MALNIGGSVGADASYSEGVASNAINVTKNTTVGKKATETKPAQLRYPADMQIEKNTDYLKIEIVEYEAPGFPNLSNIIQSIVESEENASGKTQSGTNNTPKSAGEIGDQLKTFQKSLQGKTKTTEKKADSTIFLPIPGNLTDTNSVGWGPDSLDPLSAFGVSVATGAMTKPLETFETIKKELSNMSGINDNVTKAVTASLAGSLVNSLSGNVSTSGLISRATGQVFNPNLELLFEGPNLRAFPFTFDFAPRNHKEGETVRKIIRTFKRNMMAKQTKETEGGVFLSAPNVFKVSYMTGNKPHPFLNRFKPMALTDMQINYTGSGTYATYHDGTPVHIQMTLTFKELDPIYADDYKDIAQTESVGY